MGKRAMQWGIKFIESEEQIGGVQKRPSGAWNAPAALMKTQN